MKSRRRSASNRQKKQQDKHQTHKEGGRVEASEEFSEFAMVKRDRDAFDLGAWYRSLLARLRMPAFRPDALDPGAERVRQISGRGRAAMMLDRGHDGVTISDAKAPHSSLGLVAGAEVRAKRDRDSFLPGTIILPITEAAIREADPRTLHLFFWDATAKQYQVVLAAGVNLDQGYVWGRVCRPGWYGAFGLPASHVMDSVSDVEFLRASHLSIIIARLFSQTGPWQSLGPRHLSCCILDLALDPSNTDRLYAAASDGGVWRLDAIAAYPTRTWTPTAIAGCQLRGCERGGQPRGVLRGQVRGVVPIRNEG